MTEKTILEQNAQSVEKEDLDAACKKLLANKVILARILKSCVEEFKDCSLRDIECQASFYPGYPLVKRGVYYGGRMISSQYGTVFTKSHYEKLEKVYSIWICINPPMYRKNSINIYSLTEQQLLGDVREKKENYDLLTVALLCLGDEDDANCEGILRLLTILFSDKIETEEKKRILEEDFDIAMVKGTESEVYRMCNYGDYVERRGIEKGLLSAIKNLMETMEWSAEQAMNALKVEENAKGKYLQMLEENIA